MQLYLKVEEIKSLENLKRSSLASHNQSIHLFMSIHCLTFNILMSNDEGRLCFISSRLIIFRSFFFSILKWMEMERFLFPPERFFPFYKLYQTTEFIFFFKHNKKSVKMEVVCERNKKQTVNFFFGEGSKIKGLIH